MGEQPTDFLNKIRYRPSPIKCILDISIEGYHKIFWAFQSYMILVAAKGSLRRCRMGEFFPMKCSTDDFLEKVPKWSNSIPIDQISHRTSNHLKFLQIFWMEEAQSQATSHAAPAHLHDKWPMVHLPFNQQFSSPILKPPQVAGVNCPSYKTNQNQNISFIR